jgi:myo-inositol-1(or 4)-monophosphatase
MRSDPLSKRFELAARLVREAGRLALGHFRSSGLQVDRKGLQDFVTPVDHAVEALLVAGIRTAFPDDAILGEEGGTHAGRTDDDAIWVIDPIDGTINYARGLPLWCISVALVQAGEIRFGLIFNPVADELYTARLGLGAHCNGRPIRVSSARLPEDARIGLGYSRRRPVGLHAEAVRLLLEAGCEYARIGSGALSLALVADGRLDGYWEPHINSWDVLAGLCLIREAGGWSAPFLHGEALVKGNPVLACTPALRDFLLGILTRITPA